MNPEVTTTGNVLVLELSHRLRDRTPLEVFYVDPGVTDANAALVAAVHEYAMSPASGLLDDVEPHITFTWDEALSDVPDEVWERHGLHRVKAPQRLWRDGHDCPLTPAFFEYRHKLGYLE